MDIKKVFFTLTEQTSHYTEAASYERFLGTVYDTGAANPSLTLHAGGTIHATPPYSYEMSDFPFYMLLYTLEGSATYTSDTQSVALSSHTLLFVDLRDHFRLSIATPSWDYNVMFLSGSAAESFYHSFSKRGDLVYQITECSEIPAFYDRLLTALPPQTEANLILCGKWLTNILSEICLYTAMKDTPQDKYPAYMLEMKRMLDDSYMLTFSLSDFENTFNISKYRLCREFSHYFGTSPLQYLNMRRIEVAKDLLLSTNMPVHEVGSNVGIDNTNHFINLFKKYTGTTPFAFKQEAPASIYALHFPYTPGVPQQ